MILLNWRSAPPAPTLRKPFIAASAPRSLSRLPAARDSLPRDSPQTVLPSADVCDSRKTNSFSWRPGGHTEPVSLRRRETMGSKRHNRRNTSWSDRHRNSHVRPPRVINPGNRTSAYCSLAVGKCKAKTFGGCEECTRKEEWARVKDRVRG